MAEPGAASNARATGEVVLDETRIELGTSESASVGWPWRGRVERSVRLGDSTNIRHVERFVGLGSNFFGSHELVGMLERVAAHVSSLGAPIRLSVGDLSKEHGGRIPGHRSHQSGRDVDVAFYMKDAAGMPVYAEQFVGIDAEGHGHVGERAITFDDARNWALVAAILDDPQVDVQHIFIGNALRRRLLAEAERAGAPEDLVLRAGRILMQPNSRNPHRDHMHVRIFCPRDDVPQCFDRGPYYPWAAHVAPEGAPIARIRGFAVTD